MSVDDPVWKYNHYPFLSTNDIRRKAETNKNPFLQIFTPEIEDFYARVRDTEVLHYVPELKERMLRVIRQHPPPHPDDWEP